MPKKMERNPRRAKAPSAGYPEIEHLIETEDFSEVNQKFQDTYDQLEGLAKQKRGLKKSRDAKQPWPL